MDGIEIIDSHIHLWPLETANSDGHAWMTPGHILAKPHLLADYEAAIGVDPVTTTPTLRVTGAVYIETDVNYTRPIGHDLERDLRGPLEEMRFLKATVAQQSHVPLLGLVPWAPLLESPDIFNSYLDLAETAAGKSTWLKVKGFRYLVQSITDRDEFQRLVTDNDAFLLNLKELGKRHFSFEIAVDQNGSKGTWQLEDIARVMEKSHEQVPDQERVVYIINHLCKPAFVAGSKSKEFKNWKAAIERLARVDKTYMKLSGAFSELPDVLLAKGSTTEVVSGCIEEVMPWFQVVMSAFGPNRTMFGSDWPVCTVGFTDSHKSEAWKAWKAVVEGLATRCSLSAQDLNMLWGRTVRVAYRL